MSKLRILDHTGDTVLEWVPTASDELIADVEAAFDTALAEQAFRAAKEAGHLTYAIPAGGTANDATVTHTFDPTAAEIVASPQTVGG